MAASQSGKFQIPARVVASGRAVVLVTVCMMEMNAGLTSVSAAQLASRKGHHGQSVVPTHDFAPDTTATIPSKLPPKAPSPTASQNDDETVPVPFHLPPASRARMRECGEKWRDMKMSGDVGEEIWRTFATHCLANSGPLEKRSP